MKTIERMLMQIFDRKRWIEEQLRQQLDSYGQSLAFNAMADGVMPPPWVLAPISDGLDCSVPEGRDSHLLKSQYHLRSSYVTEKEVGFVKSSSSRQANCSSSLMKVDHHVCENARLKIRIGDSQENTNYGTSTKERAELESSNCKSIANREHLPELEPVVECHYSSNAGMLEFPVLITDNPAEEVLQVNKYAESSSVTEEVGFDKSCSPHLKNRASNLTKEDLYACGNTWPKMKKTKPLPEFSNCKSIIKSQNLQEPEPVAEGHHSSNFGVSKLSVVTEGPSEEMLQVKKVAGSSAVTEKEMGFVKSSSYHQANCSSNFMEVDPHECETTWPLRRKRENQADTIYGTVRKKVAKPFSDFSICKSVVNFQLPEPEPVVECHHSSHVEVSKFSVIATESPSEEMLLDKKYGGSSSIPEKVMGFVKSNSSHHVTCSTSLMNVDPHVCEITWPKRRKRENQTDTIYGTATKKRTELLPEFSNCKNVMRSQDSQLFLETNPMIECHHSSNVTETPSEEMCQGNHISARNTEVYERIEELNSISRKHQLSENLDFLSHVKNWPVHGISDHACFSKGQRETGDIVDSGFNLGDTSCRSSDLLFFEKVDEDVSTDPMPEYERFIPVSGSGGDIVSNGLDYFDSALDQDCVNEETCSFRKTPTPLLNSSTEHKIHNLANCYHSSPGSLLDQFNYNIYCLSSSDSDCIGTCGDAKLTDFFRNRAIDTEGASLRRPKSLGKYDAIFPLACDAWMTFTPPIKKNYQSINLEMGGVSCDGLISNPALTCFRIDENTSTHEDGLHLDEFVAEEMDPVSKQLEATGRKPLADISFYQNAPTMSSTSEKFPDRASIDSVSTEACFGLLERASQISDNAYGSSLKSKIKNKENGTLSSAGCRVKNANKARQNRSSKQKVSLKVNAQHKNAAAEKVNNPSNIVSGMSSFIPLLQQKQQTAALTNGKRDIKVKSLEAAEVAKRLEEKKAKERKMKKEAIKLERLRMEKENAKQFELEQKQKEERKKKEAEIEARKRQREEDDKKERQRKRRCIEEMQQKKHLEDKVNTEKKDIRHRAMEQKKKEVKKDIIVQKNSIKMPEVAEPKDLLEIKSLGATDFGVKFQLPSTGYDFKKVDIPELKEKEVCVKNFAVKELHESPSYEISPYRDSDDEDEEGPRQTRKFVPLWARRESVDRILDVHKLTNPLKIFSRKKSCSLDEMLSIPIRVRRLPFAPQ